MRTKENILVVIAARSGSRGLKDKNIRPLVDRPLIAYTIQHAKRWGKASNIVCSTDSRRIARIAKRYGAEVPFIRPKSLAGDKIGKMHVIRHTLIESEKIYKKVYNIIVDLDVTSPIRKVSDLDNCLRLFRRQRPGVLFSVVKSRKNPYFNMVEQDRNGAVHLSKRLRKSIVTRQDAPVVYDANASIYFYSRDYLMNKGNSTVVSSLSSIYVMDDISGFDIDNEIDFKFVEFLIKEGIWKNET